MNEKLINSKLFYVNFFYEYGLGVLLINVCVYLLLLLMIFLILFFFDLKKFRTLNEFKGLNSYNFLLMSMGFSLLSLAGMPPLTGFTSKFIMLIYLLYKNQYLMFFFFSIINIFMIYFYIQNIRFLMKKVVSQIILVKNFIANIEFNLVSLLTFLNFLNLFNIFVFGDFFLIFNSWSIFMFIG